jgi:hypothetical protein
MSINVLKDTANKKMNTNTPNTFIVFLPRIYHDVKIVFVTRDLLIKIRMNKVATKSGSFDIMDEIAIVSHLSFLSRKKRDSFNASFHY